MDCGHEIGPSGDIFYDWVERGDATEDPGAVGLDENPDTTWTGLDCAFQVEPQ